jgi:regulatory protein
VPVKDWEIRLPENKRARLGMGRPTAELVLKQSGGDSRRRIPLAVARRILKRNEDDSLNPLTAEELMALETKVERVCCSQRAEDLLNRRGYSSEEMRDKLRQDGYSKELVDEYVRRAVEVGLLDDSRYAESFARSKVAAGWGERKIASALRGKGIDIKDLEDWPDDMFSHEGEFERALELASRKRFSEKNRFQKVMRFVCGRGFDTGVAYEVARRVCDEGA